MENLRAEKSVLFFISLLWNICCTCTENFNFEKLNFFGMENFRCCGRTEKRNF